MSAQPEWERTDSGPRPVPVPTNAPGTDRDPNTARVLSAIALASIAAGVIHISAAATLGSDSAQNRAFFAVVAAAQIAWGAVALAWTSRWWLALGVVGNLVVMTTWVVSRTVGLPLGEYTGIALPVGFPDGLTTALETVIVVGAAALFIRGRSPARSAARSPGLTIATAVLLGALALSGVLSQANASDSPAAPDRTAGGGSSAPYVPGGSGSSSSSNGGTSGGGYSGGGYSGGYSGGGY